MNKSKLIFLFILVCISSCGYWNDYNVIEIVEETENCKCEPTIIDDRDGKTYQTVWIDEDGGNDLTKNGQCWMKENLNYDIQTDEIGQKYCYDSSDFNCNNYGGLYNWNTAMQDSTHEKARGICPKGWHIPTDKEFQQLISNIGEEDAAHKLTFGMQNATNSSNFSALMVGRRRNENEYVNHFLYVPNFPIGARAYFWSSTTVDNGVLGFQIQYELNGDNILHPPYTPSTFMATSIRCICNE